MCDRVPTILARDSKYKAMAQEGWTKAYRPGCHKKVRITGVSQDNGTPLEVCQALVGMEVCTIFGSEDFKDGPPLGARLAYVREVAGCLEDQGQAAMAEVLCAQHPGEFALYTFKPGTFEYLEDANPAQGGKQ